MHTPGMSTGKTQVTCNKNHGFLMKHRLAGALGGPMGLSTPNYLLFIPSKSINVRRGCLNILATLVTPQHTTDTGTYTVYRGVKRARFIKRFLKISYASD